MGSEALYSCESFVLQAGSTLFAAFGHMPLMFAVNEQALEKQPRGGGKKLKAEARDVSKACSYIVHVFLDSKADAGHSPELCALIGNQYGEASGWLPAVVRDRISACGWQQALTKPGGASGAISVEGENPRRDATT